MICDVVVWTSKNIALPRSNVTILMNKFNWNAFVHAWQRVRFKLQEKNLQNTCRVSNALIFCDCFKGTKSN